MYLQRRWRAFGPAVLALGIFGIWGEGLFIFKELESTGNYFRGTGEHAHSMGDLGSPGKK